MLTLNNWPAYWREPPGYMTPAFYEVLKWAVAAGCPQCGGELGSRGELWKCWNCGSLWSAKGLVTQIIGGATVVLDISD